MDSSLENAYVEDVEMEEDLTHDSDDSLDFLYNMIRHEEDDDDFLFLSLETPVIPSFVAKLFNSVRLGLPPFD